MIKFALLCASGHEFESWFQNGAAFDTQAAGGLILCPVCQTARVTKAIMAPAIASGGREKPSPALSPAEPSANVALLDSSDKELRSMIEGIRKRILEQTDDVGMHFPEEARKIHHGLVPERPIHGQASFEEARALIEEGVGILPIPLLPSEQN
jgi:hypothetical protein